MNFKKLGLALSVILIPVIAIAINTFPLKPDGANAAPATVFGSPSNGVSIGKTTAPAAPLDVLGKVIVSTSATSAASICLAGSFQTLPTTGYAKGCFAYQLSDNVAYVSTKTVVSADSWKALY